MSAPDTVGARLRAARLLVPGLSARELSRLAGRPETQCALIEARSQQVVHPELLGAFARVLGCTTAWLAVGACDAPTAAATQAAVFAARRDLKPEPPLFAQGELHEQRALREQRRDLDAASLLAAGWEPAARAGWWNERNPDRSWGRTAPTRDALAMVDRDLDERVA